MFNPKDRLPNQSGGLAYMLGEPNTRIEALQHAGVIADPKGLYTDPSIYSKGESEIPQNYYEGGGVGHGPWTKGPDPRIPEQPPKPETPVHHAQGQPDPTKIPQGIPSVAPRTMDPRYIQQQRMQQMMAMGQQGMMGQGPRPMAKEGGRIGFGEGTQEEFNQFLKEREEMHREGDKDRLKEEWERYKRFKKYGKGAIQEAAEGGRIGFGLGGIDKGRRAFMKWLAGILGTGAAAGTGLLKLSTKAAPKVIKEAEVIARGADGMPTYITDLIEVVKAKGTRDFIEGFKRSDYSTVHSYKGVDVIEDAGGSIRIKKPTTGVAEDASTGKMHEGVSQEVQIEIIPGEYIQKGSTVSDDAAKAVKTPDEYFEGTVRPDMDGKMKDVDEYIDDMDHLELKEIADEANPYRLKVYEEDMATVHPKKTKKASGGLAHMLGE